MIQFRPRYRKGFTLTDVLIAVTLTSVIVILVAKFVGESLLYTTYFSRHQQIRSETYALVNNVLATVIREAVAIDYQTSSTPAQLALYMDKFESEAKKITFKIKTAPATADDLARSQLVMQIGTGPEKILNSERTFIEDFRVAFTEDPTVGSSSGLQDRRSIQPMVEVYLQSRFQRLNESRPDDSYTFFEDPRISFQSRYTLRNYSFSNLRTP